MARVETFSYKLAGMRKPEEFIVYPNRRNDGSYLVQGNHTIATVHPDTNQGVINWRGSNAKYGVHLAFGEPITYPREFVNLVINFCPSHGDSIGGGVWVA